MTFVNWLNLFNKHPMPLFIIKMTKIQGGMKRNIFLMLCFTTRMTPTPSKRAPDTFKFPGWKCPLHGWKYFAAVITHCGLHLTQYFPDRLVFIYFFFFFLPPWKHCMVSAIRRSRHFNNNALLFNQTKAILYSSMLQSYSLLLILFWRLPQQQQSSQERHLYCLWMRQWSDRWACF